jgi:S-DNA-T family DNA segregation ATPase FtsK/SpoIIIE
VDDPGRGYLRRGGERPVRFRVLRSGTEAPQWSLVEVGPDLDTRSEPRRIPAPPTGTAPVGSDRARSDRARSDSAGIDPLKEAVAELARNLASTDRPPSPFAPPLPDVMESIARRFLPAASAAAVPLGLADLVGEQRLELFAWSPRSQRRLAVVGGPSGGGAAFVRRLVEGAARMEPECHLYVLDGALSYPGAADLPRVACYIDPSEAERVPGMLDLLEEASGGRSPGADRVLVLTGLAAWAAVLGPAGMPRFEDRLAGLARSADGPSVVAAGDRDVASSRFFALAEHRLYLPFGLGPETTVLWPRLRKVRRVPGRAVWTGPGLPDDGVAVQLLGPLSSDAAVPEPAPPARSPLAACRPLPRLVSGDDLLRDLRVAVSGTAPREVSKGYLLGVIGPDNRPWTWDPGRVGLVLGRPGSGKTTALKFLQASLGALAVWFDPSEGPGGRSPVAGVPSVVLVDDAADLSTEQRALVEQWHRSGSRVVLAAAPGPRLFVDLPLAAAARAAESVLVLNPRSPTDADMAGWRVEPLPRDIPGRGVVMLAGAQRQVQCAHP